jgi:hypothetical protein
MLKTRLRWFLDKQGKLDPAQSGFRPRHSTIDNLVQLEAKVLTGMANNKYTGAVFIDISKVFDLVWHDGLLYKLRHLFHITGTALFHQILPQWQENTGYGQSGHLEITFLRQWYTKGFCHQSNSLQSHDQ